MPWSPAGHEPQEEAVEHPDDQVVVRLAEVVQRQQVRAELLELGRQAIGQLCCLQVLRFDLSNLVSVALIAPRKRSCREFHHHVEHTPKVIAGGQLLALVAVDTRVPGGATEACIRTRGLDLAVGTQELAR